MLGDLVGHDLIGPDRAQIDLQLATALLPAPVPARIMMRTDCHPARAAAARAGLGILVVQRPAGLADPVLTDPVAGTISA